MRRRSLDAASNRAQQAHRRGPDCDRSSREPSAEFEGGSRRRNASCGQLGARPSRDERPPRRGQVGRSPRRTQRLAWRRGLEINRAFYRAAAAPQAAAFVSWASWSCGGRRLEVARARTTSFEFHLAPPTRRARQWSGRELNLKCARLRTASTCRVRAQVLELGSGVERPPRRAELASRPAPRAPEGPHGWPFEWFKRRQARHFLEWPRVASGRAGEQAKARNRHAPGAPRLRAPASSCPRRAQGGSRAPITTPSLCWIAGANSSRRRDFMQPFEYALAR